MVGYLHVLYYTLLKGRSAPNDWLNRFFYRNGPELEKLDLFRISPHGFRHSQATLLFEFGVDPKNAQYRLRHKKLKNNYGCLYPFN